MVLSRVVRGWNPLLQHVGCYYAIMADAALAWNGVIKQLLMLDNNYLFDLFDLLNPPSYSRSHCFALPHRVLANQS